MDKNSVLYQLMDIRVNEGLDGITQADEEYQEISKRSGEYLDKLDRMGLPQDVRALIDRHASEQNALGARYGALAYLLGIVRSCSGTDIKIGNADLDRKWYIGIGHAIPGGSGVRYRTSNRAVGRIAEINPACTGFQIPPTAGQLRDGKGADSGLSIEGWSR